MASTTGTITANGQSVTLSSITSTQAITVFVTGTYAGIELVFEGSTNGSTWYPVAMEFLESSTFQSSTSLLTNATRAYTRTFNAVVSSSSFRARARAFTSGTMNVVITSVSPMTLGDPNNIGNPLLSQKVMAQSIPVVIASNQSPLQISETNIPVGSTAVEQVYFNSLSTSVDNTYLIPNGLTLTIFRLSAGSESAGSGKTSKVEVFYDPNGTGTGMTSLHALYTEGSSWQHLLERSFVGNGTRLIRTRTTAFSGSTREVFAKWEGYTI